MREAIFTIDAFEGKEFRGYTTDEKWNGFACPYFTFEQAQAVVAAHREQGGQSRYETEDDCFVFDCASEHGESFVYPSEEEADLRLYPVGAFEWIWHEEGGC